MNEFHTKILMQQNLLRKTHMMKTWKLKNAHSKQLIKVFDIQIYLLRGGDTKLF